VAGAVSMDPEHTLGKIQCEDLVGEGVNCGCFCVY